jgi:hypothetical protein
MDFSRRNSDPRELASLRHRARSRVLARTLGPVSSKTPFFGIGDIDQCVLFRVGPPHPKKHDLDETHFHVALWYEDLLELFSNGWVEGVAGITPRQWAVRQCEELTRVVLQLADGRPIPLPEPDDFDDTQATVAVVSRDGMRLTEAGLAELERVVAARRASIPAALADRIEPLIQVRAYDAAVREACLFLERFSVRRRRENCRVRLWWKRTVPESESEAASSMRT